jgi:hypothetical protein
MVANISDAPRRPAPGSEQSAPASGRKAAALAKAKDLRIYQHSNLAYWWVVWVYGFLCAAVTYAQGIGIRELATRSEGLDKVILFHPSPWLGLSFIGLILFVIIFTNVRARGLFDRAAADGGGRDMGGAEDPRHPDGLRLGQPAARAPEPRLLSDLLDPADVDLVLHYLPDRPLHLVALLAGPGDRGAQGHAFNTEGMIIQRLPDDLFRHRVLGLGTGDFVVKPASGDTFEIHNVWRANSKQRQLEDMIATRAVKGV